MLVVTSTILLVIRAFTPLRMTEEELKIADHAVLGEIAYDLTVETWLTSIWIPAEFDELVYDWW